MALIVYAIAFLLFLYWYFTNSFNYWKNKNVPYPKPLPIVGNILNGVLMRQSFAEVFQDLYQKSKGPICGFYIFKKPCLLIRDPKIIKRILTTDFQYFYDRNIMNNKRDDPISTHILFIIKNPEWKDLRTKISPVYTSAKIRAMSKLIELAAVEMKEYLDRETKKNTFLDMKEVSVKFTVNVITSTAFGVDANSFEDDKSPFYVQAKKMLAWDDFVTAFRIRCYFLAHWIVKVFKLKLLNPESIQFLDESFRKIMDQRAASQVRRNDLIDILNQIKNDDKQLLDGDILTAQAVVFFAAGFETSSSTIAFALHELALHPEIQTRLREEINQVSERLGGINYDTLKEMQYLDMVFHETLRKYPVIPVLERKSNTRYTIPETGTVIDKDTPVFITMWAIQHDPEYFPDPEVFNPERFSSKNKSLIDNYTYLPFGEGPRGCIGARFGKQTVKVGLATIIQNFVLEPGLGTEQKIKFDRNGFALSALNGIKLNIKRIE